MKMHLSRPGRLAAVGALVAGCAAAASFGTPAQAGEYNWTNPNPVQDLDDYDALRTIHVDGVEGTLTDVDVQLLDVGARFPRDVDVMLYAPGGHRVVLMSDSCGQDKATGLDLTIDDEAANAFPVFSSCGSGSYRPTDNFDGMPDHWRFGNATGKTLDSLDGIDPNGAWIVEFSDDYVADPSELLGGWRLTLTTATPLKCNGLVVDVNLAKGDQPTNGPDVIRGTTGNDTIDGLAGNDTICGLDGNDVIQGGPGDDVVLGGAGTDTASYASAAGPVTVSLATGQPQFTGGGTGSDTVKTVEHLRGSAFNDTLTGNALANDLLGLGGLDDLRGAAGPDRLFGGPDTDTCDGGADSDTAATCEDVVNVP